MGTRRGRRGGGHDERRRAQREGIQTTPESVVPTGAETHAVGTIHEGPWTFPHQDTGARIVDAESSDLPNITAEGIPSDPAVLDTDPGASEAKRSEGAAPMHFEISRSGLGLLEGLTQAYEYVFDLRDGAADSVTINPHKWDIKKDSRDTRVGIPGEEYAVVVDEQGRARILANVQDFREPSDRGRRIEVAQTMEPSGDWVRDSYGDPIVRNYTLPPLALIDEGALAGQEGRRQSAQIMGEQLPAGLATYFNALHTTARTIATTDPDENLTIDPEVLSTISRFTAEQQFRRSGEGYRDDIVLSTKGLGDELIDLTNGRVEGAPYRPHGVEGHIYMVESRKFQGFEGVEGKPQWLPLGEDPTVRVQETPNRHTTEAF